MRKRFITSVTILVAFVLFASTLGIFFLVNSSVFIGQLFKKKDISEDTSSSFFGTFQVDDVENATNSAYIIVSGSVTGYDRVEFYLNDAKVETAKPDTSGNFSRELGTLDEGENEIYLKARSTAKKIEKESKLYSVLYKKEKPKLEIEEPSDGSKVNKDELVIKGKTDIGNSVRIDGSPTVVDAQGNFNFIKRLSKGESKITLTAVDIAGNLEQKILTITFE